MLENLCEEADFEKSKIAEQQKLAAYDISKKKEQMKYSGENFDFKWVNSFQSCLFSWFSVCT